MNALFKISAVAIATVVFAASCAVVYQGNVGVKRTVGKIKQKPLQPGIQFFFPIATTVIQVPIRTVNLEVNLNFPSKEGLNVNADISILYHIDGPSATSIVETIGKRYEETLILPVFRASAADVTARYMAKDMHTGNRSEIEQVIQERMMENLGPRGFIIEAVLLKSIELPKGLARAIEEKLEAEQDAQRMEFILLRERQEAQRRLIEAEGIRDANKTITEGLTPGIIQYKSIEAFKDLSKSPNTKVIITDGKAPFLITDK